MYRFAVTKTLLSAKKQFPTASVMIKLRNACNKYEERKVNVNGININIVKSGFGPHTVLLSPGSLGSAWTDYKPQIENLDKSELTIVAWDPPGYGKSRPPNREYPENFFESDADFAHELMKILGFHKFSLIGWSGGGISSIIFAAKYPRSVRKLIVFGTNTHVLPSEMKKIKSIRDIDNWSEQMKAPFIAMYGEHDFRITWSGWVDSVANVYKKNNGDMCKKYVPKIKCPTLIIYGAKDTVVHPEHAEYLKNTIKGSQLKIFEKGAHNLHLKYSEEFNEVVTKFLLE